MVTVEVRATGRRKGLVPSFPLPIDPVDAPDPLTLRRLIASAVRAELAAADERRSERAMVHVLSDRALAPADGAFRPGGRRGPRLPTPEAAVASALEAFTDGLFLVLVDGAQHEDLDGIVVLRPDSTIVFVRLVALVGG